jgi:hypothetical protein
MAQASLSSVIPIAAMPSSQLAQSSGFWVKGRKHEAAATRLLPTITAPSCRGV